MSQKSCLLSILAQLAESLLRAGRRVIGRGRVLHLALFTVILGHGRVRGLTVPTPPGCFILFVERGIEAGGMIALDAAGTFHQVVLRLPFQLAAGTSRRAIVAGPRRAPIHQDRQLRRGARVVQRCTTNATPAQLLRGAPFRVVVVTGYRRA